MSGGWNTIESDAGVFTYLVENLGVKATQLEELTALDPDFLKQQSPVYGVIFLFKYPTGPQQTRDTTRDGTYDFEASERLFFASQTIQNACGTQALLSILLNMVDRVDVGDPLGEFREFTGGLPAEIRGEALSNSELIRSVHNSFARSSPFIDETQRTANEGDDDVYHFIAYVPVLGQLYELDGLQPAPISHGNCTFDEFPEKVIPVLQRRIQRYPADEIRFNLMAVVKDQRISAREEGDVGKLMREEHKRVEWRRENALRRHNFVGFTGEVLKCVVRQKLGEKKGEGEAGMGGYEKWVEEAKRKTRRRMEERGKGRGGGGDE
ncbi:MAG: hypothetical protein M1823_003889 [Watsoniomyces obsoletus]|nr:MAG: hypothetical protein M1823_003889 [Watsoniomyces obsoletus]